MNFVFAIPHLLRLKATAQAWEAGVTGADQTRMVKRADELGYDMISTPEHFIIPNEHLDLSGPHYFHAAAAQAYFAGATQRILINSSVAILPLQHPIVTAKALATIDWLSSGRAIATFGVGWLEKEFEILGVPFKERGGMADEYLAAIIELWTSDAPCFEGKYVSFRDVAFEPKPVQKPHLPIWVGGDSDAALKRAARFASGWWPFLTRQGIVVGLVAGLIAVTLTENIGAQFMPWGRWPMTLHSAFWGIFFNLSLAVIVSTFTQNKEEHDHKMIFHNFLHEHSALPKEKRGLIPVAWIIVIGWFFFGIGPGAVIGNWIFGDPTNAATWLFGIPSIWSWQILWWALGVGMMWFLAYKMELSRVPRKEVEALHEDIGDIEFDMDRPG